MNFCLFVLLLLLACATSNPARFGVVGSSRLKSKTKKSARDIESAQIVCKASTASTAAELNALDLSFCGLFATAMGDFIMHPVDTIKVTQQLAGINAKGFFATAMNIFKSRGPVGFYPGILPYVTGDGLSGAIKFATFETSKKWLEKRVDEKHHAAVQFACAAGAMIACSIVLVPAEVLKCRLQAGTIDGLLSGIKKIVAEEGVAGLFSGYYATLVRDVPYTMLELGLYENIKVAIRKYQKRQDLSQNEELSAAAITGAVTGYLTTPLDLVKTQLMTGSASGSVADGLKAIYKAGGYDGLFIGSTARVAWLLPFTTIYLGIYEFSKRHLLELKKVSSEK